MNTHEHRLISLLYDAVGNEGAWHGVVRGLCEVFKASTGLLVVAGQGQRDQSFYAACNHTEAVAQAYSSLWWQHDVWLQTALEKGLFYTGNISVGTDYVDASALRQTAFYKDFLLTMPAEHLLVAILADGSDPALGPPTHLSFFRPPSAANFSVADKALLQALYPHIHRAFALHWQWRSMRGQLDVFHTSMDSMDFGVLFVDAARRVQHANKATKIIANYSIDTPAKSLKIAEPVISANALAALLLQAPLAALVDAAALGQGGAVVVQPNACAARHNPGAGALMALALPVSAPVRTPSGQMRASVMLLLVDPAKRSDAAVDFVSNAFALSKAEARLLPLLLRGCTPQEIAQQLNVKLPTVRSHLSAVFAKTGTSRQQELIRLLGAAPPVH